MSEQKLAVVGDVITDGPIPGNVLAFDDSDEGEGSKSRWHRVDGEDQWTCAGTKLSDQDGPWVLEVYGPLTVTAVRQPESAAEATPCPDHQPHEEHTHSGFARPDFVPPAWCPGVPAAEPQPESDLLDLVRRACQRDFEGGLQQGRGSLAEYHRLTTEASDLRIRIEAEVQRLRDKQAWLHRELVAITGQRDAWIEQHRQRGSEVEKFKASAHGFRVERDEARAQINAEIEQADEHAAWATRLANAVVERLDVPITEEAHTELWEAALDALKAPAPAAAPGRTEQARDNHDELLWVHGCGHVVAVNAAREDVGRLVRHRDCTTGVDGPWRPLYVATDAPQQDGPVVLTLPEVPEGAVALLGVESGRRYARGIDSTGETVWAQGIIGGTLGEVLDGEPDGVTVEMAPPREPRTWPKLDGAPAGLSAVRGASGMVYRLANSMWRANDGTAECDSLPSLQNYDGPLTEVFDDEAGIR